MTALAKILDFSRALFVRRSELLSRQGRFFASRGWEAGCGGFLQGEEAPDRLVFLVSLILLPLMWIL